MSQIVTGLGRVSIEPARPEELAVVMGLLDDASAWLHARGITQQWPWPQPARVWRRMEQEIEAGEIYLARLAGEGRPVGTLRLEWRDDEYWPDDPEGGGYVHSLAVAGDTHGVGLGAALIEWAKGHVRERGRPALRLDCSEKNPALWHYYERLGFRYCGTVVDRDYVSRLYEWPL